MTSTDRSSCVALILAPHGRDAPVAAALLREAGTTPIVCSNLPHFVASLSNDIGCAVVAEEALHDADLTDLVAWVATQPKWSDFPFIVLTQRDSASSRDPDMGARVRALGNVVFLERPFHPTTFVSVVANAQRGRHRQYEARSRMEELRDSEVRLRAALAAGRTAEDNLRRLNETLESKVIERTTELEHAHQTVLEEIRQRERTEEVLRQVQKMEMIGQLTGGVAHDFNNLLMAVMGNLELLRKHVRDEKLAGLADGALRGAQRGASLTQRLLAFARQQDLKIKPVHLSRLIGGMTDLLERSVGAGTALEFALPAELPLTLADGNQIELALLNLVVNARDAMPEGGTITIEVRVVHTRQQVDLARGDYVSVTVSDTGHGMDATTRAKAMEPFFTTKPFGKGTGLGLSMVHGLALQLGGALRIDSTPGRGTKVELWLPVTSQASAEPVPAEPASLAREGAAAGITILLVDDDALISDSTAYLLEDLGHKVIKADSGEHALEVLRDGLHLDLLITDYSMPNMTGMQLAHAARELRPGLPIVMATGYADLPAGMSTEIVRLRKPYQQHQLVAEIAKALAAGRGRAAE